jgi:hypothetical protein
MKKQSVKQEKIQALIIDLNQLRYKGIVSYAEMRDVVKKYFSYSALPKYILEAGFGIRDNRKVLLSDEPFHIRRLEKCIEHCTNDTREAFKKQVKNAYDLEAAIAVVKEAGYHIYKEI